MTFGEKIRNKREDMDLSQNDMAKQIPMNQSNYSKIERDIQEPSIGQFKRICEILNLDPAYLLNIETQGLSERDKTLLKQIKSIIQEYK